MTIIGTLLVKMALDAAGFRQEMAGSAQTFVDAGRRIGQAGMDLAPVSLPILALGRSALTSASEFESGMNVFQATSGATAVQMEDMRVLATQLGADMQLPGTSAADAAEAMIALGQRGLEVNEVFDAARGVLQLSAAGQLSNARAAELTASALNAFQMAGSEAANVANLMAAGSTSSGTSIERMGQAMQASATVFSAAGIPIEQLVTSIGMMAKAGIQGSDAGTSLKTMLLSLQAPSDTAAAAMKTLGVNIYDAQGSMLPFPQIIDQFSRASAGLSEEQRNAAMTTIFGTDAVRAANVVMLQGVDAFTQMEAASTRQNVAADLAAARMQGLGGAVEGFRSSMETTLMNAVMPFLPQLTSLVQSVGEFIGRLGEANPALLQAGVAVAGVLAVAGPLLMLIGPLTTAFAVLTGPIGLVVLAIAAVAAAFASGAITIDSIRPVLDAVGQAFNFVKGIVEQVWTAIQGIISGAMQVIHGDISGGMETIRNAFSTAWTNISTQLGNVLQTIITYVQQNLPTWIARLGEWATAAWEWLVAAVPPMLQELGNFVGDLLEELGRRLPGLVSAFLEWAGEAVAWLGRAIPPLLTKLGLFVGELLAELGRKLPGWITAFLNWAAEAVAWVARAIPPLLVELGRFLGAAVTWIIGTAVPALVTEAVKLAGALIDWVANELIPQVGPALGEFLVTVVNFLVDMVEAVAQAAWSIGEGIVSGIRQGVSDLWDSFRDWIGGLITAVIDWLKGLMGIHSPSRVMADEIGRPLIEGIALGAQEAAPGALTVLVDIVTSMVSAMSDAASGMVMLGSVPGASGFISSLIAFISDLVRAFDVATRWMTIGVKAQADAFNAAAQEMLKTLQETINLLADIGSIQVPASGAAFVQPLIRFVSSVIQAMHEAISWITHASINVKAQADAFAAAALELLETLSAGVTLIEAIGNLRITTLVEGTLYRLVDLISRIVQLMSQRIAPLTIQALAAVRVFAEAAGPVLTTLLNAVDTINAIQTIKLVDVHRQVAYIADRIVGMVDQMRRVAAYLGTQGVAAARAFAEAAGPVLTTMLSAVDTINAIQTIKLVDVHRQVAYIADRIVGMVDQMRRVAGYLGTQGVAAARAFAEAAGPVLTTYKTAVDTVIAIQSIGIATKGSSLGVGMIAALIEQLVNALADVASRVGGPLTGAAKRFAERVGPILGIVQSGVDALESLTGLVIPEPGVINAGVAQLGNLIELLASTLADVASRIGDKLLVVAKSVAEKIEPVIGVVSGGVDAIAALGSLKVPEIGVINAGVGALGGFIEVLANTIADVASRIPGKLMDAAKEFAEKVGPVVGIVRGGVDAFKALLEMPKTLPDIDLGIGILADFIYQLADAIADVAGRIDAKLMSAASEFATKAGAVVGLVSQAVTAINALEKLKPPQLEVVSVSLDLLALFVEQVAIKVGEVAQRIDTKLVTAASEFAAAVGQPLSLIGQAVDLFNKIAEFRIYTGVFDKLDTIISHIWNVLRKIGNLRDAFTEDVLADAKFVIEQAVPAMQAIQQAMLMLAAIGQVDLSSLAVTAYNAGVSWIHELADGITSGMSYLEAALQGVANLFPRSPAKAGPLRQAPDWEGYMLSGLDQAGDTLVRRLTAAMPAGGRLALAPAATGATGARGGQTINVTIHNPKGQPSERSLRRELLTLSQLGVLE